MRAVSWVSGCVNLKSSPSAYGRRVGWLLLPLGPELVTPRFAALLAICCRLIADCVRDVWPLVRSLSFFATACAYLPFPEAGSRLMRGEAVGAGCLGVSLLTKPGFVRVCLDVPFAMTWSTSPPRYAVVGAFQNADAGLLNEHLPLVHLTNSVLPFVYMTIESQWHLGQTGLRLSRLATGSSPVR